MSYGISLQNLEEKIAIEQFHKEALDQTKQIELKEGFTLRKRTIFNVKFCSNENKYRLDFCLPFKGTVSREKLFS